ncbi:hypothetical protein Taro_028806 [Colocasia esculenta]|uniref:Uncharacterized protein n=1 Tax=Colocasia esculenta TaxID=4460 RepID=A0A843VYC5_COLES|nr:hypothetical protein [Colocasia esculenta]
MAVVSTATSLGLSPAGGTSLPSFSPSSSNSLSLPSLFLSLPNKPGFLSVGRRQQRMGDVTGRVSRRAAGVTMSLEAGVGVMGTKLGMMTYFEPQGAAVPVTVVGFREGNIVTQVKTGATDSYEAVQVGYRRVRDKKLTKPELGHLQKAGTIPMRHLQEFRLQSADGFEPGQKLSMEEIFKEGDLVDVSGTSIGKGFQDTAQLSSIKSLFVDDTEQQFEIKPARYPESDNRPASPRLVKPPPSLRRSASVHEMTERMSVAAREDPTIEQMKQVYVLLLAVAYMHLLFPFMLTRADDTIIVKEDMIHRANMDINQVELKGIISDVG